ncbi:MAG: imidazole glycerol phosphate synthase subunit HisH [Pseudomonadota bacterium]
MSRNEDKRVGIADYGVGNLASLEGALRRLGYKVTMGHKESGFTSVRTLFLPGVGSFGFAAENLRQTGLDRFITNRFHARDLPVVGICLGMQLLFEHSEEGDAAGLGLLEGRVQGFSRRQCHVGWNLVQRPSWVSGDADKSAFYFNHSFRVTCPRSYVDQTADYDGEFPAIVSEGLFTGVQFHPEKSQMSGQLLLRRLVEGGTDS